MSTTRIAIATFIAAAVGVTVVATTTGGDPVLSKVFHSPTSQSSGNGTTLSPVDLPLSLDTATIGGDGVTTDLSASNFAVSLGFFGDGSDGDVTISGNTTLAKTMFYDDLTINSGVTLTANSFRIFVYGTLTMESGAIISRNGAAGAVGANGTASLGGCNGSSGGSAGTLNVMSIGTNGGGNVAGSGQNGGAATVSPNSLTSVAVNSGTVCSGLGSVGGDGTPGNVAGRGGGGGAGGCNGTGSSGAGPATGSGGTLTVGATTLGTHRWIISASNGRSQNSAGITVAWGQVSTGGGGGGCSRAQGTSQPPGGGGAGASGGWLMVAARKIVCNSCTGLQAKGGAGGNGGPCRANEGGGGAGGGGGGGIITCIVGSGNCAPTDVSGGDGGVGPAGCNGSGLGAGGKGGDGGDGHSGTVIFYRMGPA